MDDYLLLLAWQIIVSLRDIREKLDDEFGGLQGNVKDQSLQGCQTESLQAGDFMENHAVSLSHTSPGVVHPQQLTLGYPGYK